MKRFWLVLLSLGLVMAFSASAFAVDVKFSGEFYVAGQYFDKINLIDNGAKSGSTAFYFQRLRLKTEFVVSPGLSLILRANIMDRAWGADRTSPGTALSGVWGLPGSIDSAGTTAENQNIAFDWAYIHYVSPTGIWDIGYQLDGPWGTKFGDSEYANPRVFWILPIGNWMLAAGVVKLQDHSYIGFTGNGNTGNVTDNDCDKYAAGFLYQWKGGQAGLLVGYWRYALYRPVTAGWTTSTPLAYNNATLTLMGGIPYIKAKFGPVDLEAEMWYVSGKYFDTEAGSNAPARDITSNILAYVDATVDLGMVYFGGLVVYITGDDPNTTDKVEGTLLGSGENLRPALIMFNDTRYRETGSLIGNNGSAMSFQLTNGWLLQGRVGFKPTDKLDIQAKLTYAFVDKKPLNYVGTVYGTEIDVTATYKITNNLSYMLGAAYLFTGDYFKGTSDSNTVTNDYLLINKLTLTF